ncbi:hypothetical protein EVAR_8472_1 [Eumeta japonica]|uniref:Uncharacterized protein n=1 Tax=Eumeta variegata TaxID=151549 RepID=A0A4C2A4F3_EUMVA|nr:hypothetical protein EVAR_8472_1 [Eumeta japonica]
MLHINSYKNWHRHVDALRDDCSALNSSNSSVEYGKGKQNPIRTTEMFVSKIKMEVRFFERGTFIMASAVSAQTENMALIVRRSLPLQWGEAAG